MDEVAEKTTSSNGVEAEKLARRELYDLITDAVADVRGNVFSLDKQVSTIQDLAQAYRSVAGGPQS